MIALSVRQPWAWLIANGHKDVENRSWPTRFRGPVLIHAGSTMTRKDYLACIVFVQDILPPWTVPAFEDLKAQCGGIVGAADVVDCVAESDSPWFVGDHGFVMRRAKVLRFRAYKGALGFFDVPWPPPEGGR